MYGSVGSMDSAQEDRVMANPTTDTQNEEAINRTVCDHVLAFYGVEPFSLADLQAFQGALAKCDFTLPQLTHAMEIMPRGVRAIVMTAWRTHAR